MKRVVTLLTALLLGTLVSTSVYAETDADVWCETNVGQNNDVSVSVETNGKVTDGVLAISYDPSVLSCTEADVEIADTVDMYSVNVVDESVKISFLAENAIEAGEVVKISFDVVDKSADKEKLEAAIKDFTGEAFNESGNELVVKTAEGEKPGTPGGSGGSGQQNGATASVSAGNVSISTAAQSVNTGDIAEITYLILILTAGGFLMTFAIAKAMAGTGRKLNH